MSDKTLTLRIDNEWRDAAPIGDLPHRDADQDGRLSLSEIVKELCDKAGLDPGFVSEIDICPGDLYIRHQLKNDHGHKYVIGTDRDPECSGVGDPPAARAGELAEEVIHWKITT